MSAKAIAQKVRQIYYGSDIGERPPTRQTASSGSPSISGDVITGLDMESGQGDKLAPGHILSRMNSTDETDAYAMRVLTVATDTISAVIDFDGHPASATANDYESLIWDQNPKVTELQMHEAIDTIIETQLAAEPAVLDLTTTTLTPDLANGTHDMPADTETVYSVTQLVGNEPHLIPFELRKNQHTSVSANGNLLLASPIDGSTMYVVYGRKYTDTTVAADTALILIVATGAAAILAGHIIQEKERRRAPEAESRVPESAGQILWRDFLTLKANFSQEIGQDFTHFEYVR